MAWEKLKILTYRWHTGHQYELWKLGHSFALAKGAGTAMCDSWDYGQRPLPRNATFRKIEEINPKEYDLAILHFDENVLHPELCNGQEASDWGKTFRTVLGLAKDLPRIAICHGTPQFAGQYEPDFQPSEPVRIYEDSRRELAELLADTMVVCNSHQAEREWGFRHSTTIWHGFSPEEYVFGTHVKDCLAPLLSSLVKRGHYMGFFELKVIIEKLRSTLEVEYPQDPGPEGRFAKIQEWAVTRYAKYRENVGKYSFYLNTTNRSPMPRSRGEAMLCGVIPLTFNNHDTNMFIRNGHNGYASNNIDELVDFAVYLKKNTSQKEKVARAARETAKKYFHIDSYLRRWEKMIALVL